MNADITHPIASVIVPAYKTESTLERCVASIQRQSLSEIEIILVDDGSPDGVAAIAQRLMAADSRIVYVSQENKGLGAARNLGIDNARGEYLAFIDSDDFIDPNMIEAMVGAALSNSAAAVCCEYYTDIESGDGGVRAVGHLPLPGRGECLSGNEAFSFMANHVSTTVNSACTKLVKKSLLEEHRIRFPENHRFAEDMPFSAMVFLCSDRVVFLRMPLYHYIRSSSMLTTSFSLSKAEDLVIDVEEICEFANQMHYAGSLDNLRLGMIFPIIKHVTYAQEDRPVKRDEIIRWVNATRQNSTPNLRCEAMPVIQKAKILCVYYGFGQLACRLFQSMQRIPAIRYQT